jgi:uncharacterized protein (DUF736 family)
MNKESKMAYQIEKVGVAWNRKFKNGKEGIKISIDKQIYIAHKNTKKQKETDPDYIVVKYIDDKGKQ